MAIESQNEPKSEQAGDFRFCNAAKAYVKEINSNQGTGKIGEQINFYWLCAQLGMVAVEDDASMPTPPSTGTEMTDEFVGKTRDHQILIRSFLMYRYLLSMSYGIEDLDEDNAESVEKSMDSFLQTTGSHLTNRGIKEMDTYAQKGWDILESKGINYIKDLETFLVQYVGLLEEYASKR